jgi:hypothetical protein
MTDEERKDRFERHLLDILIDRAQAELVIKSCIDNEAERDLATEALAQYTSECVKVALEAIWAKTIQV